VALPALIAASALTFGCGTRPGGNARLSTLEDSASYVLGYKMGLNMHQQSAPVKPELFYHGMEDGMAGSTARISDSLAQSLMMSLQVKMMGAQHLKDSAAGITNKDAGARFLAENKGKEGVVTTASGLQYKIIKAGTGPHPKPTSQVTVHYIGKLLDGTEFDASKRHGGPATFTLNQVIPGWTEGVQLMNSGSTYQIWIPGELAYGPQGSPPTIPPNATLSFEVELLSFK
jgi:FKBP-type peptidyl-prolyl cis-trans isomerase FkpA/FKBP-type peptidyl-prolyl cis-trans isomerase FklB